MTTLLKTIPVSLLSVLLAHAAFSRFSHGKFAPWWYAFQIYHAPDDGSTAAIITPYIDLLISVVLLFGRQSLRISAAAVSLLFFVIGLAMQVAAGKKYIGDVALVVLGITAVWGILTTSEETRGNQASAFSRGFWVISISAVLFQLFIAFY
ncbi:uncharacterized protein APUU_31629A [Aspergillus puulaauensis]|uniref:Uncharacterized protein n=1 Tax=Aspergillus puulaauensis TaxID=1220207 RepID=A0A7R7XLD9_9EURO|nr:uncharacterized protein APUU_31629A [Aspergillus puulaauensis]BCS23404.1 hypothetical protein APUU_31629A [Aspergillus puulaauensis]